MLAQKRVRSETATSTAMANERPSKAARMEVDLEAQGQEVERPHEDSGEQLTLKGTEVEYLETDESSMKWKVIATDLVKFVCCDDVIYVRRATLRTVSRLVRTLLDNPNRQDTKLINQEKLLEQVIKLNNELPNFPLIMRKAGKLCRAAEVVEELGIEFDNTEKVV